MSADVLGPGGKVDRLHDRMAAPAVLDDAAAEVREPGGACGGRGVGVAHDRIVHEVGDVAALVRVQPEREEPEHDRLQVEHQEPADQVRRVADAAAQQEPRGLERAARDHDRVGGHRVLHTVAVEVAHAPAATRRRRRAATSSAMLSGRSSQRPRSQRTPQHRDRIALGVDRAAVERAEPAVVARRPTVVRDAVGARRRAVRVVAESLGRGHGERGEEHVGARRHRVRPAAPRRERVAGVVAGDADEPLGLRVERLQLVVVERPVGDVGALDRPELRRQAEVDLAVARQLAVGVEPGAADGRRHVVEHRRPRAAHRRRRERR